MKVTLITVNNNVVEHGIRSISAYLKRNGIQTQLLFLGLGLDYSKNFDDAILQKIKEKVNDSDIIGITTMSLGWPRAVQLIRFLKANVSIPLIVGGIHATAKPDECLQEVDRVCVGEGENAMLSLLKGRNKTHIPNLLVKTDKGLIRNESQELPQDLDIFGIPDYDPKTHLIYENGDLVPFTGKHIGKQYYLHTARGCPHSCTYCINSFLRRIYANKGNYMRKRSIPNVMEELEQMRRLFPDVRKIFISDDTFFYRSMDELTLFAQEYKKKIGLPFGCYASPLTMDERKLQLLIDAGLCELQIGVQTGSDRMNSQVYKRHMPSANTLATSRILNKYANRIVIDYQFIISNPYETRDDLLQTLRLIQSMPKPFTVNTFNLSYFFGTPLYELAVNDGIIRCEADTATQFHFYDIQNHMKLKKLKERYLNSMMFWIAGKHTTTRYGFVPAFLFNILISRPVIAMCEFLYLPIWFGNWFKTTIIELVRPPA